QRVNVVVADLHTITALYGRILTLGHGGVLSVVEPHHDLPCRRTAVVAAFGHLIADNAAGHGARSRCGLLAVAATDGGTQKATGHGADHGTQNMRVVFLDIHLTHALHGTALIAYA